MIVWDLNVDESEETIYTNTKHKFVFKSNYEQKFNIQKILNNIVKISKKF